jgi:regulatory protein
MESGEIVKLNQLAVFDHSLGAGKEFEDALWQKIKKESDFHFAWDSAIRMLSIRAHSEGDLIKKLRAKGFAKSAIDDVLKDCHRLELIDDAKFAEMYVSELRSGGAGMRLIKMKLRSKGISEELSKVELEEKSSVDDEIKAAKIALSKKEKALARESDPRKKREKLYRYLASKGFNFDVISQLCGDRDFD